jgi:hypothetical protein
MAKNDASKETAKRIYVVEEVDADGEIVKVTLVNARTAHQAIGHAVRGKFSAHPCSVAEARQYKEMEVVEAGAE